MNILRPVESLRSMKEIRQLSGLVSKADCVLLDTPMHNNIGDLAIAYAERRFITRQAKLSFCEINAKILDSNEKYLSRIVPQNKLILVHGGGFLGSLWPAEELRFRRILAAFPTHKILVFPQTVTFATNTNKDREFLRQSQNIYSSHPQLTVCVREANSQALMQQLFPSVSTVLIPDIVTNMQIEIAGYTKKQGVLICMRHDHEKVISDENLVWISSHLEKTFGMVTITDMIADTDPANIKEANDAVIKKLDEFSKAELIITDRLHGMIFAALAGTPCVAINNSNKKVEAVYTWIKNNSYIQFSEGDPKSIVTAIDKIDLTSKYSFNNKPLQPYFTQLENLIIQNQCLTIS